MFSIQKQLKESSNAVFAHRLAKLNAAVIEKCISVGEHVDEVWLIPDCARIAWLSATDSTPLPIENIIYEIMALRKMKQYHFDELCDEFIQKSTAVMVEHLNKTEKEALELTTRYMTSFMRSLLYSALGTSRTERYNNKEPVIIRFEDQSTFYGSETTE